MQTPNSPVAEAAVVKTVQGAGSNPAWGIPKRAWPFELALRKKQNRLDEGAEAEWFSLLAAADTMPVAWETCQRGDWMLWTLHHLTDDVRVRVRAALAVARLTESLWPTSGDGAKRAKGVLRAADALIATPQPPPENTAAFMAWRIKSGERENKAESAGLAAWKAFAGNGNVGLKSAGAALYGAVHQPDGILMVGQQTASALASAHVGHEGSFFAGDPAWNAVYKKSLARCADVVRQFAPAVRRAA